MLTSMSLTNRLTFHYAALPITSTRVEFLVKQVSPFETVPRIKVLSHNFTAEKQGTLEEALLEEWAAVVRTIQPLPPELTWLSDIKIVELIECELLTPR